MQCPTCQGTRVIKNGTIHNGKPKWKCKECGRQFVAEPNQRRISDETKQTIDKLLLERVSLAGVVRDRTLTVYTDVRRVMAALQIPSTATITLLLVDRSGRIFWRDAGAYDVERAAGLERALATLSW